MEIVGHDGQMGLFSSLNNPKIGMSVKTLVMEPVCPDEQTGPFQVQTSHKVVYGLLMIWNSEFYLTKIFLDVPSNISNGASWSRWANRLIFNFKRSQSSNGFNWFRRANGPIFKMKRAPKQVNPYLTDFRLLYMPWIFCDLKFCIKIFNGRPLRPL
ncbi:hypothetical protein H5410_051856 [Solanum commersonii]|uniref:Uncharacterized protein n=1 Tax=Solanum commersonii TaxID=4109 RepID=A0A9J5X1B1_SOLCO|nr:hypothetical protein H5410_051856 [Solanum commersonii]